MDLEWWHWVVGGIVLLLAELAVPAFFMIWFGLGALLVALMTLAVPGLSTAAQLSLWTVASVGMVILWFRIFKPDYKKTRAGTAAGEAIGEIGLLVGAVAPFERGRVRFQRPVLGAEEWACLSESAIPAGERVKVVAIEGSFLKVAKV
jgi:membrane protein implicated in regulation of membrane protease activity